ncbi:MAG: hypothetical protein ACRD19_15020 [Terriglobia bacterium]
MPNYGTPQAGATLTELKPGDSLVLFDAETPAAPEASIAFARGTSPSGDDAGTTFTISFAAAATAVVDVQGSNVDVAAGYEDLTGTGGLTTFPAAYTDTARFAFYRVNLRSQSAGGAITAIAQR